MRTFHAVLANSLAASLTNTFVWFAVTFWVYLQTKSVLATSVMAGIYSATVAVSGVFLGGLVDRYPKKRVMLASSVGSLALYAAALLVYLRTPAAAFADPSHPALWAFVVLTLFGAIAGNLRAIALSTLVTLMVPEDERDKANGLVGSANGVAFLVSSLLSGVVIGRLGVLWMLLIALALTVGIVGHLLTLPIPSNSDSGAAATADGGDAPAPEPQKLDLSGTVRVVRAVPGLAGLIFFSTFNNFLGGVFMALMDAYGLLLVSVETWGTLWGVLSLGFIVGGIVVSRRGLGGRPVRTLFRANVVMWVVTCFFTLRPSIVLMAAGMFVYLCLIPAVEAAEQTIFQKVIPPERQGRVFGFSQSVEQAASPITAFLVGPLAQFVFVPFMSGNAAGARVLGPLFGGTGQGRGLALLFTVTGLIGLVVTLLAMRSASYRLLSAAYRAEADRPEPTTDPTPTPDAATAPRPASAAPALPVAD